MMSNRTAISLIGAAFLVSAASMAHAETAKTVTDFTVRSEPTSTAAKSLKWDARKGRWGVTLNLDQPAERDAQLNDIQAGAYFRLTPSLRIGGAVALGDTPTAPLYKKTQPQDGAPRVRLETAFKF
jgi:guanyl-specific ribonuclease Sa